MRRRALMFLLPGWTLAAAAAPTAAELAMIDKLIDRVAAMREVRFVRNGREYEAGDAATFMRRKLDAMPDGVQTCEDFIDRIASRSSTTGQAYRLRWPDGRDMPAGDALRAELARMRRGQ